MAPQVETSDPRAQIHDGIWEEDNRIVIGIDIGTAQSGVAFTYLIKGRDTLRRCLRIKFTYDE
jgi:hypothetical protein